MASPRSPANRRRSNSAGQPLTTPEPFSWDSLKDGDERFMRSEVLPPDAGKHQTRPIPPTIDGSRFL